MTLTVYNYEFFASEQLSLRRLLSCIGIATFLACPATAQDTDDVGERLIDAWRDWVDAGNHEVSTIAVLTSNGALREDGIGAPPDTPLPLASLSKPVTAACARAVGLPDDIRAGEVLGLDLEEDPTLGQLVTHSAGIWPDRTQNNPAFAPDAEGLPLQIHAEDILTAKRDAARAGKMAYNNDNYAVLGAMIAAKTGNSYEEACADAVFTPLGLQSATTQHHWGGHGPWGGWAMSAADYAQFAQATFGHASDFATAPETFAAADIDNRVKTALGAAWVQSPDGAYVWGNGQLCWGENGDGSYFASYRGEVIVVVLFSGCVSDPKHQQALDQALFRAAHPEQ